jgi:hypothetical protein
VRVLDLLVFFTGNIIQQLHFSKKITPSIVARAMHISGKNRIPARAAHFGGACLGDFLSGPAS